MFGFFKKKPKEQPHIAAQRTNTPLSAELTRMVAQELPLLDSADRVRVYRILEEYEGPTITTQEEMPSELRQILDLG